jgi:hypothetical protein
VVGTKIMNRQVDSISIAVVMLPCNNNTSKQKIQDRR